LGETELKGLLRDALRLWRELAFRVQGTEEFFDHLIDFGCSVSGENVRFPQQVIDRTLGRIEEEKRRQDHEGSIRQWPESELKVFTHGQGIHICDLETNELRLVTEADLATWSHMVDAMRIDERFHPTFIPADTPRGSADLHAFTTVILNSRRPHLVAVYSAQMLPFFIEAWKIANETFEEAIPDTVIETWCWVNSPFMITRENIDIAMNARRLLGRPLTFGHMPVAGAAAPVTLAGALIQNTAESLALCAMRLAVDGLLHGIVGTQSIIDMKDANQRPTGPDLALHLLAASEMHAHLFGGEQTTSFRQVSAQTVSPQSLYEKMLYYSFNIASGQRRLGVGSLAVSDVGSPVQLVLDCETMRLFRHLFRDVSVDRDHTGVETILKTAPRGAYYLDTDHTARFFREECWIAEFLDYRSPLAWKRDPSDMIDRARRKARSLWEESENLCPLSDDQRKRISGLVREADAVGSGG
jgi:trimethylamine--corrinoid protein Co-methyltransferase